MNTTIVAKPNQSMLDLILQGHGSIDAGIEFCRINGLSITDTPEPGKQYVVAETYKAIVVSNEDVLKYFDLNSVVPGTLGAIPYPPLAMAIVLRPEMKFVYEQAFDPITLGFYQIGLDAAPGFVNIHPLAQSYPGDNEVNCEDMPDMYAGSTPTLMSPVLTPPMPGRHVAYHVPWTSPQPIVLWNPHFSGSTITFKDVAGNEASFSPIIVLRDHVPMFHELFIAELSAEFVSSDGFTATIRLTRSHAPAVYSNLSAPNGHMTMAWLSPGGAGLYEDPDNAGNDDVRLIDLLPGMHILGVETSYTDDIAGFLWPAKSKITQVISIS